MKRVRLWVVIATLLCAPCLAQTPQEQASKLPAGTRFDVQLNSGEKMTGRLGAVSTDSLTLSVGSSARALPCPTIARVKEHSVWKRRLAIVGIVMIGLAIAGSRV